jgi:hypothetical protein
MKYSAHRHFKKNRATRALAFPGINRLLMTCALICLPLTALLAAEPGVTDSAIRFGSTLPLQGDLASTGESIKLGIENAVRGKTIAGRRVELIAVNDFYNPPTTVEAVRQLIEQGIFLMLGSFGSPTTKAVLPMLAEAKVPAVGFTTGAAFTAPGDILNFRASYAQEVTAATETALQAGVKPHEVCAFAQNDAYGMAGLSGVKVALEKRSDTAELVKTLNQILALEGENPPRNNVGPVGVYQRDTLLVRDAYLSIKDWEKKTSTTCRFVATVGLATSTAQFIGYSRLKKENWVFSVPSPAVGDAFSIGLRENNVQDKVIATGVLPTLNSSLPIEKQARQDLGSGFNAYAFEGYVIGKMVLIILDNTQGELTRANFLAAARGRPYDLGGITVDFTNDNQGSDFVQLTYLQEGEFKAIGSAELRQLFQ